MIAAATTTQPESSKGLNPNRPSATSTTTAETLPPAASPKRSYLQAVHASQHGVILKGMRYETFWEW
jgi:hypothetical protein